MHEYLWTGFAVSGAPAIEPVTAAEIRTRLGLYDNSQDTTLDQHLAAARQYVEIASRRAYITQTLTVTFDTWPADGILVLPRPPLQSVTTLKYYDTDGVLQTLSSDNYAVDTTSQPGRVTLAYGETWPSLRDIRNAVVVTSKHGYGDAAAAVPELAKSAIRAYAVDLYEHRAVMNEVVGATVIENRVVQRLIAALRSE